MVYGYILIDCAAGMWILLQWRERETLCTTTLDPLLAAFKNELGDAHDSSLSRRLIQNGRNKLVTSNVIFLCIASWCTHLANIQTESSGSTVASLMRQFTHRLSEVPTVKIELWTIFLPQVSAEKPQTEHGEHGPSYENNKSLDSRVRVPPDAALGPL